MLRDPNQYYGSIPGIAEAFKNDPRTALSQSLIAGGTAGTPVAQGAWAVPDGIAKAAQALIGAYMNKQNEKKFAKREEDYTGGLKQAAAMASLPQPPVPAAADPMAAAASALQPPAQGPSPMPPQAAPGMGGGMPPIGGAGGGQGPSMTAPGLPLPPDPSMVSGGPPSPVPGGMPSGLPPTMSVPPDALQYYRRGIRPIEGGTDPKTGAFRTSPKGAVGPGQLMPGTAPEAARLAGVPWDEQAYRTNAEYNDKLGAAYYSKQLQDFGDPLKAAAAYNGGPGATRRAIRRATKAGEPGNWAAYFPAANTETPAYVAKFAARIGGGAQLPGNAGLGIIQPQAEAVPDVPAAPPAQAPNAPHLPPEVQSNRIAMAQQLLSSDNPDMVALAQSYLDKGLDEQNTARTNANQQQFQQGQTGYSSELADFQNARSDARQDGYTSRREALGRNFDREKTFGAQTFEAGQGRVQREFQNNERNATQTFQLAQQAREQKFNAGESEKDRANRLEVAGMRGLGAASARRNAYFTTPTGWKMQHAAGVEMDKNNIAIGQFQRFMDLNEKNKSGGFAQNTLGATGIYNWTDAEKAEMAALSKKTTLADLGGSLGTAISDGDRRFIEGANMGLDKPKETNRALGMAAIGALQRKNDYLLEFANAQADGTAPQFAREWSAFAKATPIVQYDKNGKALAVKQPMTFSEWRASVPKYDANGRKVQ